eukprot:COSAG01_NODE_572_length_15298_cov_8.549172_21_plen_80_part_00
MRKWQAEHDAVLPIGEKGGLPGEEVARGSWPIGQFVSLTKGLAVTGIAGRGRHHWQSTEGARTPLEAAICANNEVRSKV